MRKLYRFIERALLAGNSHAIKRVCICMHRQFISPINYIGVKTLSVVRRHAKRMLLLNQKFIGKKRDKLQFLSIR
jgi:hypothetical protein